MAGRQLIYKKRKPLIVIGTEGEKIHRNIIILGILLIEI